MRSSFCVYGIVIVMLGACPPTAPGADEATITPTMAERLLARAADVGFEFRNMIKAAGNRESENLALLADTDSPAWRLYYRDRQLLFAVPTRINLTALEKRNGEHEARDLALNLLQQRFSTVLQVPADATLDEDSVRVVFIEPAAHRTTATNRNTSHNVAPSSAHNAWPVMAPLVGECWCQ